MCSRLFRNILQLLTWPCRPGQDVGAVIRSRRFARAGEKKTHGKLLTLENLIREVEPQSTLGVRSIQSDDRIGCFVPHLLGVRVGSTTTQVSRAMSALNPSPNLWRQAGGMWKKLSMTEVLVGSSMHWARPSKAHRRTESYPNTRGVSKSAFSLTSGPRLGFNGLGRADTCILLSNL